ncbi:hypothetical protein [Bacillus sp. JJ722]|uniref:hypothetical protein n=1 Tax=Bacillus sp. JJ722 TaxID=3122973 RepID=UPI002FFE079D
MKQTEKINNGKFNQLVRYQDQYKFEIGQKNSQKSSEYQEDLLKTLNRIETKLDILLMQRNQ